MKYDALDAIILAHIGSKPKSFTTIFANSEIYATCRVIAQENNRSDPFRVLDGRLRALRKKGKIRSTTKGWVSTGSTGEPTL